MIKRFTISIMLLLILLFVAGCALLPDSEGRERGQSLTIQQDPTPTPIPTPIVPIKPTYKVERGDVVEMEKFSGYMYRPGAAFPSGEFPVYDGSKWEWQPCSDMYLDERGVERWKTEFYSLEGWNTETGFPTRETLEDLGLKHAADVLEARSRLG